MDDDEGAKKVLSSSFAGIVHAFVHSSQTLQHVTDAMSSFEVRESLHSPKLKYGSYGSRDLKFVPRTAAVLVTVPSAPRGCVLAVRVRLAQPPTCQNDERLIQVSDKNENVDSRQESL